MRQLWQNVEVFTAWAALRITQNPNAAAGFGAPQYTIASLYITIQQHRLRKQVIARKLNADRAAFAAKLESAVEAAGQADNQHSLFRSLHFYRCAKPTKRMRTGFVPLPVLVDADGQHVHSFMQSRKTWQQHHATLEAGTITTISALYATHAKRQNNVAKHLPPSS